MSFLTPLYVLGLLAVAAPIVFHLIRRTPRGEVPFSSLMFLSPTPPRLTRRSRLDHCFCSCCGPRPSCLLAFAFARPFLRQAARLGLRRRRAAADRRADRHQRQHAPGRPLAEGEGPMPDEVIAGCRPADQLAVFAFDAPTRPLLGFDESATLDPRPRQAVARSLLDRLAPTWGATHLGQALIDAVGGDRGRGRREREEPVECRGGSS